MTELPLNYIVAQGLGWKWFDVVGTAVLLPPGYWQTQYPVSQQIEGPGDLPIDGLPDLLFFDSNAGGHTMPDIPDYEHHWSAIGPVIEKCGIGLQCLRGKVLRNLDSPVGEEIVSWVAFLAAPSPKHAFTGPTPHLAVCNLIASRVAVGEVFV